MSEQKDDEGIDLSEIASHEPTEDNLAEAVHDAMNSALASDSAEQNSEHNFAGEGQTAYPLAIAKRSERATCKECSAAAAIIIGLVVIMIALLAMGYFVGYYEGDSHVDQTNWPDAAANSTSG